MSTSETATASPPPSSALASTEQKPNASSTSPENPASLSSLLAELQLEQVMKTLWLTNTHEPVHFRLSPSLCAIESKQQTLQLPWSDVLGAHVLTADGEHVEPSADAAPDAKFLLGIFACVCKSHKPKTMKKRRLTEFFFRFEGKQMQQVQKLQQVVNFVADPRNHELVQKLENFDTLEVVERPQRKFLVLVNPVSGPGRALQIYENKVAPIFRFANVETEVKIMDHANHGMEMVMEMPLGVYDCVVAVGGDGSLYEIVQGLMKRQDWNVAIRQPIGIIPGGSGNGLAHSIAHQSEEKGKPVNAAHILAKGIPHDLDITSVRNGKETTYSFLSLEWASIADVDIGSEKLRMLGGLRFTVAFINQLVFQRPEYPGQIWYLQEGENEEPPHYFETHDPQSTNRPMMDLFDGDGQGPPDSELPKDGDIPENEETSEKEATKGDKWKKLDGHFRIVWVMNVSHAASDAHIAPGAQFSDGYNYITFMDGAHPRKDLLTMMLAIESGDHMGKKGVQQIRTRAFKLVPERSTDLMCVDGEVVEGPYLEAQVHRGMARIMTMPRCFVQGTMGGSLSNQVPVPDERMQLMITKLKCKLRRDERFSV
ncbi:Sphingosine Kinase [Phytophthora palmivora]|uniref:Sphingosine Kinase n=1 Tax=Phytophthora palmivora TaxID=4796 RepID=A0A2P4Y562_9STRA|nr:Sphingosine Kinase [Phytophthora palmivora]